MPARLRRRRALKVGAQTAETESEEELDDLEPETAAAATATTDDDTDDDDFDERLERLPVPKPKKRKGVGRPRKIPPPKMELVELVLRETGRRDLFCKESLKALRRTCHAFKTLVDEVAGLSTTVKINSKTELQELLLSRPSIERMETFQFTGNKQFEVSDATAFLLVDPPRLKKLVLDIAGCALDVLVHAPFPHLSSLTVSKIPKLSKAIERLGRVHAWPLHELSLDGNTEAVKYLGPALASFQQLRRLTLSGFDLTGGQIPGTFTADAFPHLEEMTLDVYNLDRLGLIGQTPTLPSMRQLTLKFNHWGGDLSALIINLRQSPWLKQLTSLDIGYYSRQFSQSNTLDIAPVLTALRGGALLKLVIRDWEPGVALMECLDLPHLTHLELRVPRLQDHLEVMTALAAASFPNLASLYIYGNDRLLENDDIDAFIGTLPHLKSLHLQSISLVNDDVKKLARRVLPQLEELSLGLRFANFTAVIKNHLPAEMKWPALKKLTLTNQSLFSTLNVAARFPNVEHLTVHQVVYSGEHATAEQFINARNAGAWSQLKELCVLYNFYSSDSISMSMFQQAWPDVKLTR